MSTSSDPQRNASGEPLPPEMEAWLREHPEEDRASLERAWLLAGLAGEETADVGLDPARIRGMESRLAAAVRAGDHPPHARSERQRSKAGWPPPQSRSCS